MDELAITMAKLAGTRKGTAAALEEQVKGITARMDVRQHFSTDDVGPYFRQAHSQVETLRKLLPSLYGDFRVVDVAPKGINLKTKTPNGLFARWQLERLVRTLDEAIEIRANSTPAPASTAAAMQQRRLFLSHGRSPAWLEVQAYVERDLSISTMELAQEASSGMTIIEKLETGAEACDAAAIVMTGDDTDSAGQARARENVMHEIGYFHGKYGRRRVVLLHEEGVSVPTNLSGIVYIPFPKGMVSAAFGVLARELKAIYV